jgi:hypothetical protein
MALHFDHTVYYVLSMIFRGNNDYVPKEYYPFKAER